MSFAVVFFFFLFLSLLLFLFNNGHCNGVSARRDEADVLADSGFHNAVENIDGDGGIQRDILGIAVVAALTLVIAALILAAAARKRIGTGDAGGFDIAVCRSHDRC